MRPFAKRLLRRLVPAPWLERWRPGASQPGGISTGYALLPAEQASALPLQNAWKDPAIAPAQRALVEAELRQMVRGRAPVPFKRLAEAVRATGCEAGSLIEVGCASGYYAEVLSHLLGRSIQYVGLDYSPALVAQARQYAPDRPFILGDAARLPLADGACEVLISGCVLLHLSNYEQAIAETVRVTRRWAIFHRTPVVAGPTLHYTKLAYGVPCLEIAFGETELFSLFAAHGLRLAGTYEIGQNALPGTALHGYNRTYLCQKLT